MTCGARWTCATNLRDIYLVMAEASDGKAATPPSKEGDAGRDPDPLDASSSEPLEAGEVEDSSVSDEESSADETDSTAGDLAKHDLKVRRFAIISDLSEDDQKIERNNVKEYGSFAKSGTKHETVTSYLDIPLKNGSSIFTQRWLPSVKKRRLGPWLMNRLLVGKS